MSHFTVMVIGPDPEKQLAPYHEYECTGRDNEYVQDIDVTDDKRREYEAEKDMVYIDSNGMVYDKWLDRFYRELTGEELLKLGSKLQGSGIMDGIRYCSRDWRDGKGYRAKIHFLPEGFREEEQMYKDKHTFREFIENYCEISVVPHGAMLDLEKRHKYGYAIADGSGDIIKVIKRTNPNCKWDWYRLGGRWSGKLIRLKKGTVGNKGADQAYKKDIDFDLIRKEAEEEARADYREVVAKCGGEVPKLDYRWKDFFKAGADNLNIEEQRNIYHSQAAMLKWNAIPDMFKYNIEDYQCMEEEYIQRAVDRSFSTFAYIIDGKWFEKGSMGWWGISADKITEEEWNKKVAEMIDSLPDDTLISIYDCHI